MDRNVNLSAERIKAKREEYGYSQKALAMHCAVSVSTVKNWESGSHFPGKNELIRLASVLHTTPDYLIAYDKKDFFILENTTAEERIILHQIHELYQRQLKKPNN